MQTLSCGMLDVVPQPGLNPGPLHWEHRIRDSGPPEKSPYPCYGSFPKATGKLAVL